MTALMTSPGAIPFLSIVAECSVDAELQAAICASPRIAARMAKRMTVELQLHGTSPNPTDPAGRLLLTAPWAQVEEMLHLAGGLRHADTLRRIVSSDARTRVIDALGLELYDRVLSADLPDDRTTAPCPTDAAGFLDAGVDCLNGWLTARADEVSRRVAFRVPFQPGIGARGDLIDLSGRLLDA